MPVYERVRLTIKKLNKFSNSKFDFLVCENVFLLLLQKSCLLQYLNFYEF